MTYVERYAMPAPIPYNLDTGKGSIEMFPGLTYTLPTLAALLNNVAHERSKTIASAGSLANRPRGNEFKQLLIAVGKDYLEKFPMLGKQEDLESIATMVSIMDEAWHVAYIDHLWEVYMRGSGTDIPPFPPSPSFIPPQIVSGPGFSPTGGPVINSVYIPNNKIVGKKASSEVVSRYNGAPLWEVGSEAHKLGLREGLIYTDEYENTWIAEWRGAMAGGAWFWRKG